MAPFSDHESDALQIEPPRHPATPMELLLLMVVVMAVVVVV